MEIIVVVVSLGLVAWIWTKKHFSYWKELGIPGPEPSLLFGNTKSVFNNQVYTQEVEEIYK